MAKQGLINNRVLQIQKGGKQDERIKQVEMTEINRRRQELLRKRDRESSAQQEASESEATSLASSTTLVSDVILTERNQGF